MSRGGDKKLESAFQADLIKEIKKIFPNCIVLKTDPTYIQGFPDLLVLNNDKWASLEVKRSANASKRPNQEYYVNKMNDMSYAAFVYPENKEMVLDEIQRAL